MVTILSGLETASSFITFRDQGDSRSLTSWRDRSSPPALLAIFSGAA